MDIEELKERLRAVCDNGCDPDLPFEAADAIESLQRELEDAYKLLEQSHAALSVFYGSGWHYSDDEIQQIEKAKNDLSEWQLCTRQQKDET